MIEFNFTVKDPQGIHARPAGLFVKAATAYPCIISITKEGKTVDAKKLLAMMSLGVKSGETIIVKVEGESEETAAEALKNFLEEHL